MPKSST